jgi:photosystem II stability/assembly factor-like uncharacterized protein
LDSVPLQFVDSEHGFASGTYLDPGAILVTADAGDSWQQIASLPGRSVTSLHFTDALHGLATAEDNAGNGVRATFETADGGRTWKPAASSDLDHFSVPPVRGQFGWKLEDGTIMTSVDGGQTWTSTEFGQAKNVTPSWLSFVDDNHGWLLDDSGRLYRTVDGGQTWTQLW